LAPDYPTTAQAYVQNLQMEKALQVAGQGQIPARGTLSADAHVTGTLQDPRGDFSFRVTKAVIYDEPFDRAAGTATYSHKLVRMPSIEWSPPAGTAELNASFTHQPNDFDSGRLDLHLKTGDVQLGRLHNIQERKPGLAGTLRIAVETSANISKEAGERKFLVSRLEATANANKMEWNKQ